VTQTRQANQTLGTEETFAIRESDWQGTKDWHPTRQEEWHRLFPNPRGTAPTAIAAAGSHRPVPGAVQERRRQARAHFLVPSSLVPLTYGIDAVWCVSKERILPPYSRSRSNGRPVVSGCGFVWSHLLFRSPRIHIRQQPLRALLIPTGWASLFIHRPLRPCDRLRLTQRGATATRGLLATSCRVAARCR
jgi:hypothetical protein